MCYPPRSVSEKWEHAPSQRRVDVSKQMLKRETVCVVLVAVLSCPLALGAQEIVEGRPPTPLRLSIGREGARLSKVATPVLTQSGVPTGKHRCSVKKAVFIGAVAGAAAGAVAGSLIYGDYTIARLSRGVYAIAIAGPSSLAGAAFGAWWCG